MTHSKDSQENFAPENLRLPDMPGLKSLVRKIDANPMWNLAAPAVILAVAKGIVAYRDIGWAPELVLSEADRLAWAVDEAAREFLLLASHYGLTESSST